MKRIAVLLGAALLLAAPAFAGGDHEKCQGETQDCLDKMSGMKEAKGWVGIELDRNEDGAMFITKVVHASPAAKAGFKEGDILFARNGIEFSNYDAMKKAKHEMKPGKSITYTVKRMGKAKDLAVKLGTMPDEVFAAMVGAHLIENHVAVAASSDDAKADE